MTLKVFIFLLFSLVVTELRCQYVTEDERRLYIESFRDYEKCQFGFVNGNGDTTQVAQFDHVEHTSDFQGHHGWIVSQGNLKGLISVFGQWIVPCIYEVIKTDRNFLNGIEVHQTNRGPVGLYDWDGNLMIPDNSLSISNYGEYYKVYTNEKKTVIYKKDYSVLIPPVYDDVAVPEFYRDSVSDRNMLFSVRMDTVYGVINAKMEVVMPLNYSWIGPKYCVTNGDTTLFFLMSRREGYTFLSGLLDANGDVLLEEEFESIQSIESYYFNDRSLVHSPLHFLKKNGYVEVYDVLTQKRSKPYLKLTRFGNYFSFEHYHNVSGVLDADFNEIYVQDKVLLSSDGNNYEGSDARDIYKGSSGQNPPIYWNARFRDSIQWLYQINQGKYRFSEYGYADSIKKQPRFGLYNLKTKTSLPKMHSVLWSMNSSDADFIWGVDMDTKNLYYQDWLSDPNAKLTVTVYDTRFRRVAKHRLRKIPLYGSFGYEEYSRAEPVLFFENRSGKIGGIDAKGDVIVPFQFESLRMRHLKSGEYSYLPYFILERKGKFGLLDRFGNELIPFTHDSLEVSNGMYFVGITDAVRVCYDTLGKEICAGFDHLFIANAFTSHFQQVNFKYTYFTIDNKLYVREGGVVKRIDSTNYTFREPIIELFGTYVIAKDGRILSAGDKRLSRDYHELFRLSDAKGNVVIYNVDGVKTMELSGVIYIDSRNYDVHYRVLFDSVSTGILDRFTGLWVIPPGKYVDIYPVHRAKDLYSVKQTMDSDNWYLIDSNENVIFDTPIDYPIGTAIDFSIVRKSEKYGLVNDSLELVVPIEFDFIHREGADYFMLKNGHWKTFSKAQGLMRQTFGEIALPRLREGFLVFKEDSVAYVDFSGAFILPYVDSKTFISKHKVSDLIDLPPYVSNSRYNGWGIITSEKPSPLYDRISMENVLNFLREKTSNNETLLFQDRILKKFHSEPSVSNTNFNDVSTRLTFGNILVTQNYYSCTKHYTSVRNSDSTTESSELRKEIISYLNYRVEGDSLVLLQLEDLFEKAPSFERRFQELLILTINQQQALPEACADLYTVVDEMMERFLLTKTGIYFSHGLLKNQVILMSYETLATKFNLIQAIN